MRLKEYRRPTKLEPTTTMTTLARLGRQRCVLSQGQLLGILVFIWLLFKLGFDFELGLM